MIESGLKGSVVTYTALLRLLKRQKKLRDAMSLWDLMKNSHITPQLSTFNTMMDILVDFVDIEGALDVYDEMRQAGIEPNQSTHVILGKVIHDW
jgi:pentatricopeptide repeat protein